MKATDRAAIKLALRCTPITTVWAMRLAESTGELCSLLKEATDEIDATLSRYKKDLKL